MPTVMVQALDVARCLIRLAVSGDEPDPLTHLRLQKLLYYVQAWHLAALGKPMFRERIEAWINGPVVTDVWPHFKAHGHCSILPAESETPNLSAQDKAFVVAIWDRYKVYSASRLWEMTHNEAPWQDARDDLPATQRSDVEITQEAMRKYFGRKLAARLPKGISLSQVTRADEQIDRGECLTHDAVRQRIAGTRHGL